MTFVRRGKLETRIDFLEAVRHESIKIRIMYRANGNQKATTEQLSELCRLGLVERTLIGKRFAYRMTPDGEKWLSIIKTAGDALMNGEAGPD